MCNCSGIDGAKTSYKSVDGFNNSIGSWVQKQADKVTTFKNNTIQTVKQAPGNFVTGFLGGNAGSSSSQFDFGTAPQTQPINYPQQTTQPGLGTPAIIGLTLAGLSVLGLLTVVIVKAVRKNK